MKLKFAVMEGVFAVSRLEPDDVVPAWVSGGDFYSITKTDEELSLVCEESKVPEGVRKNGDWRGLRIVGPLDFRLKGIIAAVSGTLFEAGISIYTVNTFDTNHFFVKTDDLQKAIKALHDVGHEVDGYSTR